MTYDEIRALIDYDPLTGETVWKERPVEWFRTKGIARQWNRRFAGQPCGYELIRYYPGTHEERHSVMRLTLKKKHYTLSKLIWLYMTGEYPQGNVLQLNYDSRDLRWSNLECPSSPSTSFF